ncbi:MAG TPA: type I phosphomannose isomerase catalytic subunit, partial [Micromonosporaceae bacterium]
MHALEGTIRDYPWGSRSIIAELQGRPTPSDGPEAEYWLGAHPAAPATVHRAGARIGLPQLLAAEPGHWLGAAALERFGPRLPFLLKLLAPERPLSLQAHPDAEQARVGYAAEEAAGERLRGAEAGRQLAVRRRAVPGARHGYEVRHALVAARAG